MPKIFSKSGFTLIETIAAIFIITVGVFGVSNLIQQVISFTAVSSSRLTATYLAQEGIEIVRNIRDTNWLQSRDPAKNSPWNDGLADGIWEADYTTQTFDENFPVPTDFEKCNTLDHYNCQPYGGNFLKIDNGFYKYSSGGTPAPFKRKITVTNTGLDILEVSVSVSWEERGRNHEVSAKENIYNWK